MSTITWQDDNNKYLAASLRWLRLCLQRLAPEAEAIPAVSSAAAEPLPASEGPSGWLSRWIGGPPPIVGGKKKDSPLLLEAKGIPLEEQIKTAASERDVAAKVDPPPALAVLAQRLNLSTFERDTLLLCSAVEFDPSFGLLYARAQGSMARSNPTFSLALATFEDPAWDALSGQRPLRYAHLVEISQPGATPLTSSPLRTDERIVNFLKGLNVLDDRLATWLTPANGDAGTELAPSQQGAVGTIRQRLQDSVAESVVPVVQLLGSDSGSKLAVARQVCAGLNRRLYRVGVEAFPPQLAETETLARLWQRETLLLPVALYIDAENLDGLAAEVQSAFQRFVSRGPGLVFLGVQETPLRFSIPSFSVEVKKPEAVEQVGIWADFLKAQNAGEESAAEKFAGQFNLNLGDIRRITALALKAPAESGSLSDRVWDLCRDLTRPRLDSLAQRLDVKATWDDLVLPDEQTTLMRQIATQVRERHKVYGEWGFSRKMNRGFGISALFTGESGTGKTMAAEVIANDLRLNLYRIDLSAVVSKYIGETEKNLRKLFDAAEQGGAILFFDEADALFGKRSEVKDSHDRYANIEINYLLQRMEAFTGLAILATNMRTALDPAFMRRLRFVVNFRFPDPEERKLIWQKALPAQTPKEELDYGRLARLTITGGNIHSIALNAAFLAAQTGKPVTVPLLLSAARTELRKLERPFSEAEFR